MIAGRRRPVTSRATSDRRPVVVGNGRAGERQRLKLVLLLLFLFLFIYYYCKYAMPLVADDASAVDPRAALAGRWTDPFAMDRRRVGAAAAGARRALYPRRSEPHVNTNKERVQSTTSKVYGLENVK